jgi:hypothetical protein
VRVPLFIRVTRGDHENLFPTFPASSSDGHKKNESKEGIPLGKGSDGQDFSKSPREEAKHKA